MASTPTRCTKCKYVFCQQCLSKFILNTRNVCPNCCEAKQGPRCGRFQSLGEKDLVFRAKLIKQFNIGWTCRNK